MDSERWQKVSDLFEAALECAPAERPALLARDSGGDEGLREEVESLLAAHDPDFMSTPVAVLAPDGKRALAAGQSFGHYTDVSPLGEGGMGEVYLAVDTRLKRKVALKLLPPHCTHDPERVRRFEREALAASALSHPNIVTIYEVGELDGRHFIAAEYVAGETLRERLRRGPVGQAEALEIAVQLASALEAAHAVGIVHRDVKPENVVVRPDGYVKLLDFGLAKLTDRARHPGETGSALNTTRAGAVMGTANYMSPEQARGQEVDERTDLWSLGVVLYEMVAGRAPFAGETPSHAAVAIMENDAPPLPDDPEVSPELRRIITRALRKDREGRYQTARELANDLKSLKQGLEAGARPELTARPPVNGAAVEAMWGRSRRGESPRPTAGAKVNLATPTVTSGAGYRARRMSRSRWAVPAAATLSAVVAVAALAYTFYPTAGGEAIDSVAVLPFVNVGNDPNAEYLSEGISDSIINSLSPLPGLKRVISLNSALRYKGRQVDPQAVGREFNVRAVLMGRLTQQGDDLLISAELVDARDNRRLWGGQYTRKLADILAVQREIAQQISTGLRLRLSGKENKQIAKQHTGNPDAEIAYLKGRYFLHKRRDTEKSVEHLEEAIKLDPDYGLAHATLAHAYLSRTLLGPLRLEEVLPRAKEAAGKALAIDDTLAEAHAALGSIRYFEWDWPGAEREFKRAIELNPNYKPSSPNYEQSLVNMKRFDEAVAESKRILELDPVSVYYNRNLGMILYFARRYDEAIGQLHKTLELEPDMGLAWNWLWRAYEQKGQYDQSVEAYLKYYGPIRRQGPEAVAAFREAYARSGWKGFWRKTLDLHMEQAKRGANLNGLAGIYARLGEKEQALFWLEKAVEQRDVTITLHIRNPFWDGYRSDPRFADLVRRMGLEP